MFKDILKYALICLSLGEVWTVNDRPVVGILFQEPKEKTYGDSYLMMDYVQWVEAAGAVAVPIRIREDDDYYEDLFSKINGALFPGGGVNLFSSYYAVAAKKIVELAMAAAKRGDYFPIWGSCLGSEMLVQIAYGNEPYLTPCSAEGVMLPLQLLPDALESRVLRDIPKDTLDTLTHANVTPNYHKYCFTPKVYSESEKLKQFYRPVSINRDINGLEFISMFEARGYPFYGSQWHPEKTAFEWTTKLDLNHSFEAVKVAQYFANFFVNEARKNKHHYPDYDTLAKEVFYNYKPVFFGFNDKMFANYYLNFTDRLAVDRFEELLKWKRFTSGQDKISTSYVIGSLVVFFLLGISFVFVMDYAIAISGKFFNITLRPPQEEVTSVTGSDDDDDKVKLLDNDSFEHYNVKVPFTDGPEVGV